MHTDGRLRAPVLHPGTRRRVPRALSQSPKQSLATLCSRQRPRRGMLQCPARRAAATAPPFHGSPHACRPQAMRQDADIKG
ncbi:hypothetical protein BN126360356 [Stenotrophomonas indicatrix]|nr:hypothetical protein BN126360356 [Stenotrophomonas indicatrix]